MSKILYKIVGIIAEIHNYIMNLNNNFEYSFSDKELHFLIIGFLGMGMVFLIYPIFKALSKNHVMVIVWIYVFTVILGLTFAIEIGQKVTKTGTMDFVDIVSGIFGFLIMFIIFSFFRILYKILKKTIRKQIFSLEEKDS